MVIYLREFGSFPTTVISALPATLPQPKSADCVRGPVGSQMRFDCQKSGFYLSPRARCLRCALFGFKREKPGLPFVRGEPPALKCDGVDQNRAQTPGTMHGTTNVSQFCASWGLERPIFQNQRFYCSAKLILDQNLLVSAEVRPVFRSGKTMQELPLLFFRDTSRAIFELEWLLAAFGSL